MKKFVDYLFWSMLAALCVVISWTQHTQGVPAWLIATFWLLLAMAVFLVPVALSRGYIFKGWLLNDHFMIIENNGSFSGMKLRSDTHSFRGGNDPVRKWDIVEVPTEQTLWEQTTGTFNIGVWPIAQAKRIYIPLNRLTVIRPKTTRGEIHYDIDTVMVEYRGTPRSLKHAFQTRPVETMGDRTGQCKIGESTTLVALVTEILSVDFEIYNPYLAILRIQEGGGVVNVMQHVNETLQSVAREITAKYTYNEIIKARVEGNAGEHDVKFGQEFKDLANKSLAKYGIKITNVDLIDHHLDEETEKNLLAPQREKMKAEGEIVKAEGERQVKELEAIGDSAVLRTIMKEAKGDKDLALAELERRGRTDAARFAGEKFNGQFLTLNFGGPSSTQGPQPTVTVGSVDSKKKKS